MKTNKISILQLRRKLHMMAWEIKTELQLSSVLPSSIIKAAGFMTSDNTVLPVMDFCASFLDVPFLSSLMPPPPTVSTFSLTFLMSTCLLHLLLLHEVATSFQFHAPRMFRNSCCISYCDVHDLSLLLNSTYSLKSILLPNFFIKYKFMNEIISQATSEN